MMTEYQLVGMHPSIKPSPHQSMISSELLYKIYSRARRASLKSKPTRTHYNANTFG